MPRLPTESVDAFAGTGADMVADPEQGRRRARHLFQAAGVVAVVAWVTTFVVAVHSSERNGVFASWFAIFPSTFAVGGLTALHNDTGAGRALLVAILAGLLGSVALWVFFVGIWPAL